MGNKISLDEKYTFPQSKIKSQNYNIKVALWHIPYTAPYVDIYERHDSDNSRWLEETNGKFENEFATLGEELNSKQIGRAHV